MEISIKLNDLSINLDESLKKEIEKKVALAIQNVKTKTITKAIEKEISQYNFGYLVENVLDDLDIGSIKEVIEKIIKKSITEKLK